MTSYPIEYFKLEERYFNNFENTEIVKFVTDENNEIRCRHTFEKLDINSSCVKTSCCNYVFLEKPLIQYLKNPIIDYSCPHCLKKIDIESRRPYIKKLQYKLVDTIYSSTSSFFLSFLSAKISHLVLSKILGKNLILLSLACYATIKAQDIKEKITSINKDITSNCLISLSSIFAGYVLNSMNTDFSQFIQGSIIFLSSKNIKASINILTMFTFFKIGMISYNNYGISKGLSKIIVLFSSIYFIKKPSDEISKYLLKKSELKKLDKITLFSAFLGATIGVNGYDLYKELLNQSIITYATIALGHWINVDN